jgi:hypothetical protein
MKKKLLSLTLALVMIAGIMPVMALPVAAITLSVEYPEQLIPGEEIDVNVIITNPSGMSIGSISFLKVEFDRSVLELTVEDCTAACDSGRNPTGFCNNLEHYDRGNGPWSFDAGDLFDKNGTNPVDRHDILQVDVPRYLDFDRFAFNFGSDKGFNGEGVLLTINFRVKAAGDPGLGLAAGGPPGHDGNPTVSMRGFAVEDIGSGISHGHFDYVLAMNADGSITATEYIPFYGDIDGDGKIDAADVTLLRRFIAAEDKAAFRWQNPGFNMANARVTGSAVISAADITLLRRWIASSGKFTLGPQ